MQRIRAELAAAGIAIIDEGELGEPDRAVPYLLVPGSAALDAWRALRARAAALGGWPVLLGHPGELELIEEGLGAGATPVAETLRAAGELGGSWTVDEEAGAGDETIPGDAEPHHGFSIPYDASTGAPHRAVALAWIAGARPWEVPAHLAWGGWNACPAAEEHVATLRRWHDRWGAELVGLTGDVMEVAVTRPPADDDAALQLAREHYAYCAEIVDQGVGTVGALAGSLRGATSWSFWWD
jgi:hypothetical protein